MIQTIRTIIQALFQILSFIIIIDALLSFVLTPFHPVRAALDRIVNPLLVPIRRIVPPIMNMDFSPVVLLLLLQLIEYLLLRILG
jgi:YggT family protein